MASWAFDWIHLLDRRQLKGLRVHREPGVNHLSGVRALDQDAVHLFLGALEPQPSLQRGFRDSRNDRIPTVDERKSTSTVPNGQADGFFRLLYHPMEQNCLEEIIIQAYLF